MPVVLYTTGELARGFVDSISRHVNVLTDWRQVESRLEIAAGLVAMEHVISKELLDRLASVPANYPLARLAIVCHPETRSIDALAIAGLRYHRFLSIEDAYTDLAAIVREFATADVRDLLVAVLQQYCRCTEARDVVGLVFRREPLLRLDCDLTTFTSLPIQRLRTRVRDDLGLSPHNLVQWNTMIRAAELWATGMREPATSASLEVASTTLSRNARALLGMTFATAARAGPHAIAMRLVRKVQRHRIW